MADTGMTPTDGTPFRLTRATGSLAEGAAKLASEFRAASIKRVLADANRKAVRGGAPGAFGTMRKPSVWYAFDQGDQDTADWYPQGLTCGADSGTIPVSVFLATWYFRPEQGERGIRLTFLSPSTLKYRHALLVEAAPDGSFKPIDIHAGGAVCYGDLLYVADTTRGLRVFDLKNVLDLTSVQAGVGDGTRVGRHGGGLHAFGYRYIIPQTDFWKVAVQGARFSFVGLDRTTTPHTLISGEYAEDHPRGRVVRWNLELDGEPRDAFVMGHDKIQGAISHNGRWYLSQAAGSGANGRLLVYVNGKLERRPFPIGPEDLTARSSKVWSVTEFRNKRVVFGVNL
ncbi:hypothetical protein [Nonomuraea sp. NPDC048826]|uniref:hypothetical protein n=1 Tax=Nonomuraea sp. NPDC048826 TaxID=3364347 RepID=UPI0037221D8C